VLVCYFPQRGYIDVVLLSSEMPYVKDVIQRSAYLRAVFFLQNICSVLEHPFQCISGPLTQNDMKVQLAGA
jgi:hypothetical protein